MTAILNKKIFNKKTVGYSYIEPYFRKLVGTGLDDGLKSKMRLVLFN